MIANRFSIILFLAQLIFISIFSYGQVSDSRKKLSEGHDESFSDPYLPNEFHNKKVSPAYKFSNYRSNTKLKLANPSSSIFTTQVNTDNLGFNILGDAANETSIAVNSISHNQLVIGWRQFDNVTSNFRQAGMAYSSDFGQTWIFPGVIEPGIFRTDPVLDVDAIGNIYYNSLTNSPVYLCKVFISPDGGFTWDLGTDAAGGDKQWMAIDRSSGSGSGNIYSAWNSAFSSCLPGNSTRSANAGLNYDPCVFTDGDPIWGTMTVNNMGDLFVSGRSPNSDSLLVIRSSDAKTPGSNITWSVSTVFMDGILNYGTTINPAGLPGQVNIKVDQGNSISQGNLYLTAPLARISSFDPGDIMFSRSTDNGLNWSAPIQINDDASTANFQWFGTMAVAPNGRIDVIWLDTRDAPLGSDSSALYYSYSTDQGNNWSVNEKLSDLFDPHVGYPNQLKMGDYFDMVSDNVGANLAWANTLNGEEDVYFSRIIPSINTGLNDLFESTNYSISPNPNNGIFTINGNLKNAKIEIYSSIGEKIHEQKYYSKNIDISNQPSGFYFIKIINSDGTTVVRKVLKN